MASSVSEGLASGPSAPKRKDKSRRTHTVLKVIGSAAVVLALCVGMTVAYAYRTLNSNITSIDVADVMTEKSPEKVQVEGPKQPINIMVMGSDTREGAGNNIDGLVEDGQRSDTTILLHLSADRKRAYGISIPRDSLVDRDDCRLEDGDVAPAGTDEMWNVAFSVGGPGCTIQQFEQLTGIRIDHFVVLDFSGFQDMVDAVGGVEVCIPETIDDRAHGILLEEGTREISGKEALSYVRTRYAIGDGSDIGRLTRQQAFMSSMAQKVISAGTLANPYKLFNFLDAATKSLTVDQGLSNLTKVAQIGIEFRGIGLDKIQFSTIPWYYPPDDPNRVRWQQPEANRVWDRLKNDEPLTSAQTSEAISANEAPGAEEPKKKKRKKNAEKNAVRENAGLCTI